MRTSSPRLPILFALLLLLIAASRFLRIEGLHIDIDEMWTIWQTFGTPTQIVSWTPPDWPPLSYLVFGLWRGLTSIDPVIIHVLPVLVSTLGSAFTFAAVKRFGTARAIMAMLVYSALAFAAYLNVSVRGYVILVSLLPCLWLLQMRYFERPSFSRALWLALCLAVMFYTHLTSVMAFAMIGLYTLVVHPRQVWRWWLPGVIALALVLPEVLSKLQLAVSRTTATAALTLLPYPVALIDLFQQFAGYDWQLWTILLLLSLVLSLRRRLLSAPLVAILLWALLMPTLLYFLNPVLGFFQRRYGWWLMFGLAVLISWGLAKLPTSYRWLVGGVVAIALFRPLPLQTYQITGAPVQGMLRWVSAHYVPGDVMILDPNCNTVALEEWDYYLKVFFPAGVRFVDSPTNHRRVWYVTRQGAQVPELESAIKQGRIPRDFIGPWDFNIRLYEGPPDPVGLAFANGMRFHGVDIIHNGLINTALVVRREADPVQFRLWWSVDQSPTLDYSVSTFITFQATGTRIAAFDGPPQVAASAEEPGETSRWQPGRFYVEERTLTLPFPTSNGRYDLNLLLYFFEDRQPIRAESMKAGDISLLLKTFTVKAW